MENLVKVTNRSRGSVYYTIPDLGIQRSFMAGETKQIALDELQKLQWVEGGDFMLKNYFVIDNKDALTALNIQTEPEYFYTEAEVKELLNNGSLAQLEDALNFAPKGVIDLIKNIAVDTKIPDMRKRELITKKTGFDIQSAININAIMEDPVEDTTEVVEDNKRKAEPIKINTAPARKSDPVIIKK